MKWRYLPNCANGKTNFDQSTVFAAGHRLCDHRLRDATARASFGLYSTEADVDALIAGIARTRRIFGKG